MDILNYLIFSLIRRILLVDNILEVLYGLVLYGLCIGLVRALLFSLSACVYDPASVADEISTIHPPNFYILLEY